MLARRWRSKELRLRMLRSIASGRVDPDGDSAGSAGGDGADLGDAREQ